MVAQLVRRTVTVAFASTLVATMPALTPVASAETIYLKNGTQVKGKITKQDEETFEMLTQQGILKISKQKVMLMDLPSPVIAAGLGIGFPGAGQAYVGRWDKASFYFFITAVTFATSFVVGMFGVNGGLTAASASGITLPVAIAVSTSAIPLGLGAYDAYLEAWRQNAEPRFKIDYGESL